MSCMNTTTDKAAIRVIQKILPVFAQLGSCNMTALDAVDARTAENLLRGIVQGSTYYKP